MKLNEHEALLTPKTLLVPYSPHHVPTYHEWMQDPHLQAATASEPLTLAAEYAMQQSWRTDADKLTFIACTAPPVPPTPSPTPPPHITAEKGDAPGSMIGDVNLFLSPDSDPDSEHEENDVKNDEHRRGDKDEQQTIKAIGEVEIMIASHRHQGQGLGREILLSFLWYILASLDAIMAEYHGVHGDGKTKASQLTYLRVKIDKDNARSVKLFESVGFKKVKEEPNYFGEVELRWPVTSGSLEEIEKRMEGGVPRKVPYKAT
ncbi:hypothetical protein K458DRAFT_27302 [Lentithecium fluviatile CBS 122367]|uniref:N-acetyltransferase domain-containing protein n=1 Tax=Lentithecium fluviatile CBS 122367 TaxID=1168545 RepID=A0A6G1J3N6_9PLEO|nr:hypothetical protein K458DRAFT_27302 [Lentithecium fluviatile CBS 122367]